MTLLQKLSFFAFTTLGAIISCYAQESEQVKVRFVSFPIIADPQPIELMIGKGGTVLVDLPTNSISSVYTVSKPSSWSLGKLITDAEGKPSFQSYGNTPALASSEQLVLVIRNGKTDADGLKLIAFDDRTTNFGGGKYLFFNASKVDIACSLGETKFALKPLQHSLHSPQPSAIKGERKYLNTHMYFRKETEATPFYSSVWRYSENARTMVFVHHDDGNDRLKIHTIRDYITK